MVEARLSAPVAEVSRSGIVRPTADGQATLRLALAGRTVEVPVTVEGVDADAPVDFVHDVAPILSRLGCNQGTCHGSAQGKNGFKLSLRGYDPLFDVRALTDDLASRRVNLASPDDSLMLLKPTGAVPHVGGQVTRPGDPYYGPARLDRAGARLNPDTRRWPSSRSSDRPTIQQIAAQHNCACRPPMPTAGPRRDARGVPATAATPRSPRCRPPRRGGGGGGGWGGGEGGRSG
jgi:hypothetical protein